MLEGPTVTTTERPDQLKRFTTIVQPSIYSEAIAVSTIGVDIFDAVLTLILQVREGRSLVDESGHYWLCDNHGNVGRVFGNGDWDIQSGHEDTELMQTLDRFVGLPWGEISRA